MSKSGKSNATPVQSASQTAEAEPDKWAHAPQNETRGAANAPTATPLLDLIDLPADLRALPDDKQLPELAAELRTEMIKQVAGTGGHLGAGLGVVELSIALHRVFNTPEDRLIWDVGHQAYPHKILTGRRKLMPTLRQPGGISGFTKRSESDYDPFGAGHSSTSISAALGMAVARDLTRQQTATDADAPADRPAPPAPDRNVIAVIGDGAMSAGMAYEAMNNAGAMDSRLIVILNDNDMSIAPPVGALSAYFARLTSGGSYFYWRDIAKQLAKMLPRSWERRAARAEEYTRNFWSGGSLFEELGFYYVGPIDGHNFDHLLPVLRNVRDARQGPILIHVVTQKGKGYAPAEAAPDKLHGVGRFNILTGKPDQKPAPRKAPPPSYTSVFSNALIEAAEQDERIVAITAAMPSGTGLDKFAERFPDRCFDVGIAEQHAVTFAAGLAAEGYRPFCAIYSTFLQRAYDQIVHDVALQNLPVRFAIDRAGLVGADGASHAGSFDLSMLMPLPGMTIMAPSSGEELAAMTTLAASHDSGPIAFRFPRGPVHPHYNELPLKTPDSLATNELAAAISGSPGPIGRLIRKGHQVALLSLGPRLGAALKAADLLAARGISVSVADARYAKPLPLALIDSLAERHDILLTIEEGAPGGFGAAVGLALAERGWLAGGLQWQSLTLPDRFLPHGGVEDQYAECGLDAGGIVKTVEKLLKRNDRSHISVTSA